MQAPSVSWLSATHEDIHTQAPIEHQYSLSEDGLINIIQILDSETAPSFTYQGNYKQLDK